MLTVLKSLNHFKNLNKKHSILFLASGGGGTMQFIYYALQHLNLDVSICGVLADRNCKAINFAKQKNIDYKIVDYTQQQPQAFRDAIAYFKPDIIITTFHKIIDAETLQQFSNIKFINPHYSILPAFKGSVGIKTILKAKEINTGFVGASSHFVIAEGDAGNIISQGIIPIANWSKTDMKIMNDTIFKLCCLTLLNAILMQYNIIDGKHESYHINNFETIISPDVLYQFNASKNWQQVFEKINVL
ncbi:MAG: hypothetical protein RL708_296 [Bacteroidota bacterium]